MPRKQAAAAVASAPKKSSPARVREERKKTRKALDRCSDEFKIFRPAREVLTVVRAIPTILCQLDYALGIGGFPIERFTLVHGQSAHGKTSLAIALLKSFLLRPHGYGGLIDAEFTTSSDWLDVWMGADLLDCGRFFAVRPATYEEAVQGVREFTNRIEMVAQKDANACALVVTDSIRKLTPKNILEKIQESVEKHGVDGMGGRAAQIRAAMNAAWLDELIPRLARSRTGMLAIARETEDNDPRASSNRKSFAKPYKVGGGKALIYEASVELRCELERHVYERPYEEGKPPPPAIGERIRVTVKKTKIAGKEDREAVAFFHTSFGTVEGVPAGFDVPRDYLELGSALGVIERSGAYYKFDGKNVGQGEMAAVKRLHADPELFSPIEAAVRARMKQVGPGDGVVVG